MERRTFLVSALCVALSACSGTPGDAPAESVTIQGSDTEVQLVSALVEAFTKTESGADISVAGGGSAVGIAALINGETDVANSSRKMKDEERAQAADRGRSVREFILARDGLSAVVHPENPVTQLTLAQLADIFSGKIGNWQAVGGPDLPIVLYGRQSTSGTFGFFRDAVVKGDYAVSMRQMEGNQAIVEAVRNDRSGIGYVGVGYVKTAGGSAKDGMKVLPIAKAEDMQAYSPLDAAAVAAGDYPIVRPIYQYLGDLPGQDSLLARFLRFEASPAGQAVVEASGFYPVTAEDKAANDALFQPLLP